MKRSIILLTVLLADVFCIKAQNDIQAYIQTENGIITVSKTKDGKDMVSLPDQQWDHFVAGTKYTSCNLSRHSKREVYLEIANMKTGRCNAGIGFGCSIIDRKPNDKPLRRLVQNENRICSVTIYSENNESVRIVFNDIVNWQSLQYIP